MSKQKHFIVLFIFLFTFLTSNATDRIVQDNGPTGTYSSINSSYVVILEEDQIIFNTSVYKIEE